MSQQNVEIIELATRSWFSFISGDTARRPGRWSRTALGRSSACAMERSSVVAAMRPRPRRSRPRATGI